MQQDRGEMQRHSYAHAHPLPNSPPQAGEGADRVCSPDERSEIRDTPKNPDVPPLSRGFIQATCYVLFFWRPSHSAGELGHELGSRRAGCGAEQITWSGVGRLSIPHRQAASGPQAGGSVMRADSLEME
jgi:hypothetical protein